jgi:serine/threonine protein kinase
MVNIDNQNLCNNCFSNWKDGATVCDICGYVEGEENPVPMVIPVGDILLGKYLIGKVLGKGGFGVTYLAYDLIRKIKVAIKEYMPDSLAYRTPETSTVLTYKGEKGEAFKLGLEKFYDEAKTIAKFNGHPNIINVQEFFYENNTAYFVMEYIEGIDLKKYVAEKGGRLSEEEILKIVLPLMDSLMIVHSIGVLHRDISPDNIYIAKDGTVKLLDFGAARQVLGEQSKSLSVVLKPGFAPIEQYQSRGKQGPWTDVYSLAATMYYCLTGSIPEASMDRIDEDNMQSMAQHGVEVSPEFETALLKALSLRAVNRFQTMSEFKLAFNLSIFEALQLSGNASLSNNGSDDKTESSDEINKTVAVEKANKLTFIPFVKKNKIIAMAAVAVIVLFGIGTFALSGYKKNGTGINGGGGNNLKTSSGISTNLNERNSSNSQVKSDNTSDWHASSTTDEVVVPNVVGLKSDEAMSTIQKAGLKSIASEQYSEIVIKGNVASQSVPGGEKRISGSTINLTISKGKEFETVPSIIGKTATIASSDLTSLGFVVSIKQQVDDSKTPGTVIAQSVSAGQKTKCGSTIIATVCINSGKVAVPNVVGKTSSKAASELTDIGLTSSQTQQYSDTVANGIVISQGNAAGTKISKGSTVNLIVSKGVSLPSAWLISLPAEITSKDYFIEEKTQYQYRNKESTTTSASSLSGWTKYNETYVWGAWSGWSTSVVSSSATREVNPKQFANAQTYKTVHKYNKWWYFNLVYNKYQGSYAQYTGSEYKTGTGTWRYFEQDSALPFYRQFDSSTQSISYGSSVYDGYWFNHTTAQVSLPLTYHTEYQYRDKVFTYYFYRWNDWSAWQDAAVTATSDKEVNTKKLYRYKSK